MSWLNLLVILIAAWVCIFLESACTGLRQLLGAQIDLLPALMVYTSLSAGLPGIVLLAVAGGLGFDALSANTLGISVLPLFLEGWIIHFKRELILREEIYAQRFLGLAASFVTPILTFLLLMSMRANPLVGWGTLWQCIVMAAGGAVTTPIFFFLFGRIQRSLNYPRMAEPSFRPDRQIVRSRQ
jgi:cell shape-determining protein MreD